MLGATTLVLLAQTLCASLLIVWLSSQVSDQHDERLRSHCQLSTAADGLTAPPLGRASNPRRQRMLSASAEPHGRTKRGAAIPAETAPAPVATADQLDPPSFDLDSDASHSDGHATGAEPDSPTVSSRPTDTSGELKQTASILIAGNNDLLCQLARPLCQSDNVELTSVANGIEAVDAVRLLNFDLLVLDCELPVMGGLDAIQQIRDMESTGSWGLDRNHPLPIFALAASSPPDSVQQCLDAGANDCVTKPADAETLVPKIVARLSEIRSVVRHAATADDTRKEHAENGSATPTDCYLDVAQALDRCGHDKRLLEKVLTKFSTFCPEQLAGIAEAASNRDLERLRLHAHRLKGVSGDVAAVKLHRAAAALERASREGRAEPAWAQVERIESCIEHTLGVVDALLADLQRGSSES